MSWSDGQGNFALRALSFEREDGSLSAVPDVWLGMSYDTLPDDPRATGIVSSLRER